MRRRGKCEIQSATSAARWLHEITANLPDRSGPRDGNCQDQGSIAESRGIERCLSPLLHLRGFGTTDHPLQQRMLKINPAKKAEAKPKQIKVNVGTEKTVEAKGRSQPAQSIN
jgi:hypothetical protein